MVAGEHDPRQPGHATATGKVFLAYAGATPTAPLAAYTQRTITDPGELGTQIERIRRRGWAQAVCEREDDLNAIAAPVSRANGVLIGVIGLQGPAGRFGPKVMRGAVEPLLERCAVLSSTYR